MRLDVLTRMAANQLGMPIAMLNLVDTDRQWTKSAFGLPSGQAHPRESALCPYTILHPDRVTVIPDLQADVRFANGVFLAGAQNLRFYAGAPVKDSAGYALGALCVLDTQPRQLSPGDAKALADLADLVSSQFEFGRVTAALQKSEAHYRHAVELSSRILWTAGSRGEIEEVGPGLLAITGAPSGTAAGDILLRAVHADDRSAAQAAWSHALETAQNYDVEYRLRMLDGRFRWFRAFAAPHYDEDGMLLRWYGSVEDIDDRKQAEVALRESERGLRFALEVGQLGTWELDADGRLKMSDTCRKNLGLEGIKAPSYQTMLGAAEWTGRCALKRAIDQALTSKRPLRIETRFIWPDGSAHWIRLKARPLAGLNDGPLRLAGLARDITDDRATEEARRLATERMTYLAHHDALTGLANRRLLKEKLLAALAGDAARRVAMICIDLDNFKAINDVFGHATGDRLLAHAATQFAACIGTRGTTARYGGDEFAVLIPDFHDLDEVRAIAAKLLRALAAPFALDARAIVLGGSIGISVAPDDTIDAERLMTNADTALYRAKSDGRGTACFFEREMDIRLQERDALTLNLRDAIAHGQMQVFYQPLIDLATGTTTGFEALLRWQHPRLGNISPGEFIPIAEKTGLIIPIGRWVLEEACREARHWPAQISIAVNISVIQLCQPGVVAEITEILATTGLSPARLELEITETLLLHDTETAADTLNALQRLGVRIALDDFGAGYSSLSYLRKFDFDKIKIDRSLVSSLPGGRGGDAVALAAIGLGRSLGIVTIAEGVETAAQLDFVKTQGCTQVQGFLFSKPVTPMLVRDMLERKWW